MNADSSPDFDAICDAFEAQWKSGSRPEIAEFLSRTEPSHHEQLLRELLQIELWYRRHEKPFPSTQEYCKSFPRRENAIHVAFADFLSESGDSVLADDYSMLGLDAVELAKKNLSELDDTLPVEDTQETHTQESATTAVTQASTFDKYDLLDVAGRGGFGKVYKARDRENGRIVALKIPHSAMWKSPNDLKRFFREAQTSRKLKHPGVCQIIDTGIADGVPYIAMEYVLGETLDQILAKRACIPVNQALLTVYKLASTLAEAHRLGVVHRDLKPSNIMFEPEKRALKILDFGLAFHITADETRVTRTGDILGTPMYMSPEQVRGEVGDIDERTDIYSLGVILFEMITGRPPFVGSAAEVFGKILFENPGPPSQYHAKLPYSIDEICLKLLSKSPADRYPSMTEFQIQLKRILEGEKIEATVHSVPIQPADDRLPGPNHLTISEFWRVQLKKALDGEKTEATARSVPTQPADERLSEPNYFTNSEFWSDVSEAPRFFPQMVLCPNCRAPVPVTSLKCPKCGFDRAAGPLKDKIGQTPVNAHKNQSIKSDWKQAEPYFSAMVTLLILALAILGITLQFFGAMSALVVVGVITLLFVGAIWFLASSRKMSPTYLMLKRATRWRLGWPINGCDKILDLRFSDITDRDISLMKADWGIEVLDLEGTSVTDAVIDMFLGWKDLKYLILRNTSVSRQATDQLVERLPGTRIWS